MDSDKIADLLKPFLNAAPARKLLDNISTYIDMMAVWNARINLTAIRDPEQIVTRHFGESLFAARYLFPKTGAEASDSAVDPGALRQVVDVGSGAGFPGLPIRLWDPSICLTLIESNYKKATFLREISRVLILTNVDVFCGRAEDFPARGGATVTMRAVERFESMLPVAASLVGSAGRLALLIGTTQHTRAQQLVPAFVWEPPRPIPMSAARILLVGSRNEPIK